MKSDCPGCTLGVTPFSMTAQVNMPLGWAGLWGPGIWSSTTLCTAVKVFWTCDQWPQSVDLDSSRRPSVVWRASSNQLKVIRANGRLLEQRELIHLGQESCLSFQPTGRPCKLQTHQPHNHRACDLVTSVISPNIPCWNPSPRDGKSSRVQRCLSPKPSWK